MQTNQIALNKSVILLNGDYSFLNVISWKKAITLVVKGKAEILKATNDVVRSVGTHIVMPIVLRLIKLVRTVYRSKVPFSKKNIFIRDRFTCMYCGSHDNLTIDHITPKSMGGKSTFENCITSCYRCNNKKGSRLPSEAKMYPKKIPSQPTISEFLRYRMETLGIDSLLKEVGVW